MCVSGRLGRGGDARPDSTLIPAPARHFKISTLSLAPFLGVIMSVREAVIDVMDACRAGAAAVEADSLFWRVKSILKRRSALAA